MAKLCLISLAFFSFFNVFCQNKHIETDKFRVYGEMDVDGYKRSFILNLPPKYFQSGKLPLVIALHGGGGSAGQCERDYNLTEKADAANFIIVYPEGIPNDGPLGLRTWNAGTCCGDAFNKQVDDVHFISVLIDSLILAYHVDSHRIYVTGMSNGAMLAYRLACEISDKITAIAAVSGTMNLQRPCDPSQSVPVMHIHSILDKKVKLNGGKGTFGYYFTSVDSTLKAWVKLDSCYSGIPQEKDFEKFKVFTWENTKSKEYIKYYLTDDGGHSWPGSIKARRLADVPSEAFNANDSIWAFFNQFGN